MMETYHDDSDIFFQRLNLTPYSIADYKIEVLQQTSAKVTQRVPKHIPPSSNLMDLLLNYCDIRAVPKKKFLRVLSTFTSDSEEKRRLEELSSRQGANDYTNLVLKQSLSLLDILMTFSTCQPPIEAILENLPSLSPRYFSIASSSLSHKHKIKFLFNVVDIPKSCGRHYQRYGVCTGWLQRICQESIFGNSLQDDLAKLSLNDVTPAKIPIFRKRSGNFRLPLDLTKPMILIGSGTGVAPFIGFLEHRKAQRSQNSVDFGPIWLITGFRHKDKDYLYRNELESFVNSGTLTELFVSFSRDNDVAIDGNGDQRSPGPKYVQDNIVLNRVELVNFIDKQGAYVYVCGDADGMAKGVWNAVQSAVKTELNKSSAEAELYLKKMQEEGRYLQDIWT